MIVLLSRVFFCSISCVSNQMKDHPTILKDLDAQFQWWPFEMIESIPNFNQAELESVIWIIVYNLYVKQKSGRQVLKSSAFPYHMKTGTLFFG